MNKSHLGKTSNSRSVVTALDVGCYVNVSGVGNGVLRYVGGIHGKEGLFCGVELLTDDGKHDGSYQGVSYFVCPPKRGIFAPMYKVELDGNDVMMESVSPASRQVTERLSRSALPALQLKNVFRPEDSMNSSIASTINMDGSTISQVSWSDIDMNMSNATYIIPPGRGYYESEEFDLMAIKAPDSGLKIDKEALKKEEERLLAASYTVPKSKIGVEFLPVVEDDELETPVVERRDDSDMSDWDVKMNDSLDVSRPLTPLSGDTGYNEEENRPSGASSVVTQENQPPKETPKDEKKKEVKKMSEEKLEEPPKTEKKLRDTSGPPPAPKFPVKPKAPSKHQLMMEQLKASIEAEKNKPKKEVKPRVSLAPPPPPPKPKEDSKMAETPTVNKKLPLKAVNNNPAPPKVERPKKERKPLYVPPPPKERKEVPVVAKTPKVATVAPVKSKPTATVEGTKAPVKKEKAPQFPTSSFAGNQIKKPTVATVVPSTSRQTSSRTKPISEPEKLKRLREASKAVDVLGLVLNSQVKVTDDLKEQLEKVENRLAAQMSVTDGLKNRQTVMEKQHSDEVDRLKGHIEQLTRSHSESIQRLKERHEQQLTEKSKEYEKGLEDERCRHEAELEAMSRRHQKVVVALDEKIAEAEKLSVQLKADKTALQTALANDSDQRNQMLTKEIYSLQTALEFKSSEMKELRQKYQQVSLRVEEIPIKDLEIQKLKHKISDLKQSLDQKINYEKLLLHQNEELKRQQLVVEDEKEEMKKSIDVMMYKYENGEEVDPSMTTSRYTTPSRVNFRSRSSNSSSHRPPSGIPPEARLSQSSCSDMDKSTDRDSLTRSTISMYTSQIRLPDNHAQDVIYAPDEIILSSSKVNRRLSFSEEEEPQETNGNPVDNQTDSGIVM